MLPYSFAKGGKEKRCCLSVFPFFFYVGWSRASLVACLCFLFSCLHCLWRWEEGKVARLLRSQMKLFSFFGWWGREGRFWEQMINPILRRHFGAYLPCSIGLLFPGRLWAFTKQQKQNKHTTQTKKKKKRKMSGRGVLGHFLHTRGGAELIWPEIRFSPFHF